MKYNAETRHYFEIAARAGVLSGAKVYRGAAGNRAQGTWVQFDLRLASHSLTDARFLAFGCPHTIAAAAWVAEQAVGKPAARRLPESVQAISLKFAVPLEKLGRLLIVEDAWLAAVDSALKLEQ
jgi:NifU-like protein involved in Fe-S cluster formation